MLRKSVSAAAFFVFLFAGGPVQAGDARQQLKESIDEIIAILRDETFKPAAKKLERREKIFKVLEGRFDFAEMGKRSLAAHWKEISGKEREEFVNTFARLMENSYITKIEKYTDEEVIFKDERPKGEDYYYINTEVVSGAKAIPINYSLYNVQKQWRVYDVHIEGVSLVEVYRTEFSKTIRKEKFAGLMAKLKEKLKGLERDLRAEQGGV